MQYYIFYSKFYLVFLQKIFFSQNYNSLVLESDHIKCFCPTNHPTVRKLKIAGDFAKIFWYLSNTGHGTGIGDL